MFKIREKGLMVILTQVIQSTLQEIWRLDSNIESKSLNNTCLNIIKIFNKLLKKKLYSSN